MMKIIGLQNHEIECECVGCAIAAGELTPPGGIIAETANFILHQDPEVPIKGFLIVASRRHIRSMMEMSGDEAQELFSLVYRARLALRRLGDIQNVTIIQEERSSHFHLWLLPRYAWMDAKFDHSLATIREMMRYAKENCKTAEDVQETLAGVKLLRKEITAQESLLVARRSSHDWGE
jgi:diadenosine tetraphosphate (Ap4A) HIT family hydrolase